MNELTSAGINQPILMHLIFYTLALAGGVSFVVGALMSRRETGAIRRAMFIGGVFAVMWSTLGFAGLLFSTDVPVVGSLRIEELKRFAGAAMIGVMLVLLASPEVYRRRRDMRTKPETHEPPKEEIDRAG